MDFTCCYRDKDGSQKEVFFVARDRDDAFRKAKSCNLNVISMVKGKGHPPRPLPIHRHRGVRGGDASAIPPTEKHNKTIDQETKVFKAREHSYILGYLLGPLGFVLACLIWKQRGLKYATYGLGMAIVSFCCILFFGLWGFFVGAAAALAVERMCIPRTVEERAAWAEL